MTIAGNYSPKYDSKNPIARLLVKGFLRTFDELVAKANVTEAHEVGCGEGVLARRLAGRGIRVRASDVSAEIVALARSPGIEWEVGSVYDLKTPAPLVVCCEVLEHVEDPERALANIATLAKPWALLSVPREPLWRVLNVARLTYLRQGGNTPGHLHHWSTAAFLRFVERHFDIVAVRRPVPWTFVLCRARESVGPEPGPHGG